MRASQLISKIESGDLDAKLKAVYVSDEAVELQKPRYVALAKKFIKRFGNDRDVYVLSAPGRTEVCGNHTDHNHGKVLAASINLDAIAIAAKNNDNFVREKSDGHPLNCVELSDLAPNKNKFGHSTALVKGVVSRFNDLGYNIGGFDACTTSDVMAGSGLSSSAAFEVLLGTIVNYLYNDGKIDPVTIAKVAQYSENVFFGKPCGLLDQMASSVGTFVTIDFKNIDEPVINKVDFDFSKSGYSLCIVDTHGNHSDLTDDYASIRTEMESVANALGYSVLRDAGEELFMQKLPQLVGKVSDRALVRANHFFNENIRVEKAVKALENNDFEAFKNIITDSGNSSYMYCQNIYSTKKPNDQKLALAICLSKEIVGDRGAVRVHGGGFAGTIQAFVPNDLLCEYQKTIDSVFGDGSCHILIIRPVGGTRVI